LEEKDVNNDGRKTEHPDRRLEIDSCENGSSFSI